MLNLSSLFFTTGDEKSHFLDEVTLTDEMRDYISRAKTEVRECLREGLPLVLSAGGYPGQVPRPRFFTQGSWAYKTINSPAHSVQQADIDDGAYLPLSFVSQTSRPSVASSVFFDAAAAALAPLVTARGWRLVTDKPTCVRVEISTYAHIDVPLYAIPDQEFVQLSSVATVDHGYQSLAEAMQSKAEQDAWDALPRNSVLLAHREEDWIESDPRPVKDWFIGEVAARGDQLRRVIRYLKAFRDWQWESGGPSSILLMAAATPVFERRERRDDLALLEVVAKISGRLRAGVNNPTDETESLTDRLGRQKVEEAAQAFERLEEYLRGAIDSSSPEQACSWMVQMFGNRFPNEPERVKSASIAETISAAPAAVGPSELVGRQQAG